MYTYTYIHTYVDTYIHIYIYTYICAGSTHIIFVVPQLFLRLSRACLGKSSGCLFKTDSRVQKMARIEKGVFCTRLPMTTLTLYLLRRTLVCQPKDLNREWSPRFSTLRDKKRLDSSQNGLKFEHRRVSKPILRFSS